MCIKKFRIFLKLKKKLVNNFKFKDWQVIVAVSCVKINEF